MVNLKKGGRVDLTKGTGLNVAIAGLGWDTNRYDGGKDFDLDLVVFMLGADGKCINDEHMIFYGSKNDPANSVVHSGDNRTGEGDGDDESCTITFASIPENVEKLVFCVTIFEAVERAQNFGMVDNCYVRIVNQETGTEECRYDLCEDFSTQTSVVFAEIYKNGGEWKLKAVGEGYEKELGALCAEYGIETA